MSETLEKGSTSKAFACKPRPSGRYLILWRRLWRRKIGVFSLVLCVLMVLLAVFGGKLAPHDPFRVNTGNTLAPPGPKYPFGTDELGRCILSRLMYGARYTVVVGTVPVLVACCIGTLLGLLAGGVGGVTGLLIMRLTDLMLAFPYFLLVLTLVAALGPGLPNIIVALSIWMIPHYIRLVRGMVLSIREREFVQAAYIVGESVPSTLLRYVLPNCLSPLIVQSTLDVPRAVISGASLGFLGFGARPPIPEWGTMISTARQYMGAAPHLLVFPGLFLVVLSLSFNLLGDALRDILDPRIQDVVT